MINCGLVIADPITTLVGYTEESKGCQIEKNDFELIRELIKRVKHPVIGEGNINTPQKLKRVMEIGVYSVVIGSAITRPQLITKKFTDALTLLINSRISSKSFFSI